MVTTLASPGTRDHRPRGRSPGSRDLVNLLLVAGALILAAEPAVWLFNSWSDPVWNSNGWLVGIITLVLLAWSATSARTIGPSRSRKALWLLAASAGVRLLSQYLGINVIGALTLAVDVYAVALLLGTDHRRRPVSAFWLAALFILALPLERVIQRVIGYGLQKVSAEFACRALELFGYAPVCNGIQILLDGQNVLVDVPCSGARGLLTVVTLFIVACVIKRPGIVSVATGVATTLGAALLANTCRIVLLALGLTQGEVSSYINVMEAPWHEAIGTGSLLLGAIPVVLWAKSLPTKPVTPVLDDEVQAKTAATSPRSPKLSLTGAALFCCGAIVIVTLPASPIDVSTAVASVALPNRINGEYLEPLELNKTEKAYFTQYGGDAHRGRYGDNVLLAVNTTSPVRHLHAPDECLRAIGHKVRYLGIVDGPLVAGLYRSVDPAGNVWRISVSFVSEHGEVTTSVAHAVWLWMRRPGTQWTMVQRIRRWDESGSDDLAFADAVKRVFDIRPTHIDVR